MASLGGYHALSQPLCVQTLPPKLWGPGCDPQDFLQEVLLPASLTGPPILEELYLFKHFGISSCC